MLSCLMAFVDIFVGNGTFVDREVYQLWLGGYSAEDAAHVLHKRGILQQYGATLDMLLSDIQDHYRTYTMIERYLKIPHRLDTQLAFQISPDTQVMMIERYYTFDPVVVREILGKKLSSRDRNCLDDISEKTMIPLKSCRRQFDNIKRVFKHVEELKGSLIENIKMAFQLSDDLSRQYAAIVFMANNRFETTKKKLAYLTFADFICCANLMIQNWSCTYIDNQATSEDVDVGIEKDFLIGLREVKSLSDKENLEKYKMFVMKAVAGKLSPKASHHLENNFKTLSKTLVNVAYGLNHNKELRDLFVDLVEHFVEPCKQAGWSRTDVKTFLKSYQETASLLVYFRTRQNTFKVWQRYLSTIISCIIQLYHD
ncbi:hypothetical protein LSH36_45g10036 [Paralvinella palmiformis]|uniref:Acidic fibroblast growth factor intracellular-binding protein n=1 Tax=Paralvinella palmiformis TaxID=53620 RepID=A0AAD9K866_9ANNE|nr:hypothetical protein LSH36_45g10036 [Paralvinella palmiformis]